MMKHKIILLMFVCVAIGLHGCGSAKIERSEDLIVVEQTDSVFGSHEENNYCRAFFDLDVPVDGPQALVDSVMVLINREVYDYCESCSHLDDTTVMYSLKEVYTDDGNHLLSHYMEKYEPLLKDSLWNMFHLTLKMEVQTESYVTYGLEHHHCGASCGSEKFYYTFDKRDGHQLKEIISHKNLVRFFEDYPEYATQEGSLWKFSPEANYDNSCYGLLDDHFSLIIIGWYNHYFSVDVPYGQIFSYLSPETQVLVERNEENEPMLPAYLFNKSHEVSMEVDTVNCALLGCVSVAGGELVDTLKFYDPAMEIHPSWVYSIDASNGSTVFLLIYSYGNLLYLDEAMTCMIDEDGLKPVNLFAIEDKRDSVVSCMWYDQPLEASEVFPFDSFDENRFGLHYDSFLKRLYSPILESHDPDSEFTNTSCLRYTGRFEVLQFNGKEFVSAGTDGAWWLNPNLRNYKRTVSNRITADGIEQIDLMPDSTYRRAIWIGAKTLDDLRKKPDEVKIGKNSDFNETDRVQL